MSAALLFKRHFQIAYVADDAQAATDLLARPFGITQWKVMDMGAVHGPDTPTSKICLAWIGDVMIEVIEPNLAVASLYSSWRRDAAHPLRFHHLGFLVDSLDALEAAKRQLGEHGHPVATEGSFGDTLDFLYVDTTASLGHYYEIIHLKDKGFFADVPVN